MIRMMQRAFVAAALCMAVLAAGTVEAQTATRKATVLGTVAFTSFVENMDRSLAFYHDAFGMEVPALPASGTRPYNPTNPQLFLMFDIGGAKERHQSARLPGTNVRVEIMEIQNVPHKTVPLRIQDPGVATLVFLVRDVNEVLARAKQAHAEVVTPGKAPIALVGGGRSVLIRDIDGRLIELRQPATLPAEAGANGLLDMRLSIAVADLDRTLHVYRDVLGFTVDDTAPAIGAPDVRALTGLGKVKIRGARVHAHDSPLSIEFAEYTGVNRKPLHVRIQDRGAARLQLRVDNVDDAVAAMTAAGLKVESTGGKAVPIPPNFKGALVADPDDFFLTPFAPCDGCAPRLGVVVH